MTESNTHPHSGGAAHHTRHTGVVPNSMNMVSLLGPGDEHLGLIERSFDADAVRRMKAAAGHDISVGGPELAAQALGAGLVDECHLLMAPVVVGGGKPALPALRLELELLDERRFAGGTVFLRYRVRG